MKTLRRPRIAARPSGPGARGAERRTGAALMMSLLVLFILLAVVFQISIATSTDARVTRNVVNTTSMESAIESVLLKFLDELKQDAEQGASAGGGGGVPGGAGGLPGLGGAGGGGADTDSHMDDWARPRPTTINGIEVTFWAQDEDSKYNVLTLLTPDPEEQDKAVDRVERILDFCREGTEWDIDASVAGAMATAMREYMQNKLGSELPRPVLLTDDEDNEERGLPLTLGEFLVLPEFAIDEANHIGRYFEDFFDDEGVLVHSLATFLTVHTSIDTYDNYRSRRESEAGARDGQTELSQNPGEVPEGTDLPPGMENGGPQATDQAVGLGRTQDGTGISGAGLPGAGPTNGPAGVAVNINTAPRAVLEALFDDRDLPREFWFHVLEYRNEELEKEDSADEDEEPLLDEFGEEILELQTFQSIGELGQIEGWENLEPLVKAEVEGLVTVKSHVFSVFLTARRRTGGESEAFGNDRQSIREERAKGDALTVSVRCLVWRRQNDQEWQMVPIERWERLPYEPYTVEDFPDEDRR